MCTTAPEGWTRADAIATARYTDDLALASRLHCVKCLARLGPPQGMPPQPQALALEALRRVQDGLATRDEAPDASISSELDRAITILNQAGRTSPDRLRRRSSRVDSLQQIEEQCGALDEDGEVGWGGMMQENLAHTQRSTALQRGKLASAQIAAAITAGHLVELLRCSWRVCSAECHTES